MTGGDPRPEELPTLEAGACGRWIGRIVALGNRFPGTAGETRCRDFLLEQLEAFGLSNVRAEPFRYLAYEAVAASCRLPDEDWELPCTGLQCTADAAAEGEAVFVGAGTDEELAVLARRGVEFAGKVAVAQSFLPSTIAPELSRRGVAALVNIGETPDGLVPHFTAAFYPPPLEPPWDGRVLRFPGVTVEAGAGRRLLSLLSAGRLRLRVEHRARYVERASANVIGEIPGADTPEENVIVGAHYDTQRESPGASDNGTGLAVLLELGRTWNALEPRRTVTLAAWGAEELACWGSYSYALARSEELPRAVAMLNLDALGLPFPGTRTIVADPALSRFAAESAARVGWQVESQLDASLFPYADHIPFVDAGVPAAWIWRFPPQHPYYHSPGDTLRWIDLDRLADDGMATAYTLLRLAQLPEPGIGRAERTRRWATIPPTDTA